MREAIKEHMMAMAILVAFFIPAMRSWKSYRFMTGMDVGKSLGAFRLFTNISDRLGMVIGVIIFEILGLALYPVLFTSITQANAGGKVTGSNATIVNLIPLMYAIVLLVVPAAVVVVLLKSTD